MFEALLSQRCQVLRVRYAQDKAGAATQSTAPVAGVPVVACAVQQDRGPSDDEGGQARRGSTAGVAVFFADDPEVAANDQIRIAAARPDAAARVLVAAGPAFDASGQAPGIFAGGVLWQVDATEAR